MKHQISNNRELGIFFREMRKEKGMTIEQVAKQAGISQTTLRNMERSRGHVRTDVLLAMSNVVGLKIELSMPS